MWKQPRRDPGQGSGAVPVVTGGAPEHLLPPAVDLDLKGGVRVLCGACHRSQVGLGVERDGRTGRTLRGEGAEGRDRGGGATGKCRQREGVGAGTLCMPHAPVSRLSGQVMPGIIKRAFWYSDADAADAY